MRDCSDDTAAKNIQKFWRGRHSWRQHRTLSVEHNRIASELLNGQMMDANAIKQLADLYCKDTETDVVFCRPAALGADGQEPWAKSFEGLQDKIKEYLLENPPTKPQCFFIYNSGDHYMWVAVDRSTKTVMAMDPLGDGSQDAGGGREAFAAGITNLQNQLQPNCDYVCVLNLNKAINGIPGLAPQRGDAVYCGDHTLAALRWVAQKKLKDLIEPLNVSATESKPTSSGVGVVDLTEEEAAKLKHMRTQFSTGVYSSGVPTNNAESLRIAKEFRKKILADFRQLHHLKPSATLYARPAGTPGVTSSTEDSNPQALRSFNDPNERTLLQQLFNGHPGLSLEGTGIHRDCLFFIEGAGSQDRSGRIRCQQEAAGGLSIHIVPGSLDVPAAVAATLAFQLFERTGTRDAQGVVILKPIPIEISFDAKNKKVLFGDASLSDDVCVKKLQEAFKALGYDNVPITMAPMPGIKPQPLPAANPSASITSLDAWLNDSRNAVPDQMKQALCSPQAIADPSQRASAVQLRTQLEQATDAQRTAIIRRIERNTQAAASAASPPHL